MHTRLLELLGVVCFAYKTKPCRADEQGEQCQKVIAVARPARRRRQVAGHLAACRWEMSRRGHKVAVLDADITGPSIPRIFGVKGDVTGCDDGIFPLKSGGGVLVMSVNLLLDKETTPVAWRGPIIANTVRQFWSDVVWGEVDYMFVDMPPGTGDVPLTVFQSLPVDGAIIVTSPQELVGMIVAKAKNMAQMMGVPVLGVVENYSWLACPDCGKKNSCFRRICIGRGAAKHARRPACLRVSRLTRSLRRSATRDSLRPPTPSMSKDLADMLEA